MTFSKELITVFDYLAQKLGIAIDWTNENVMPYLKDLAARFIEHEILHSYGVVIAWAAFLLFFTLWLIPSHLVARKVYDFDWGYAISYIAVCAWIGFIVCVIGTVAAAVYEGFHIIECYNMPEKVIIDYIEEMIHSTK